MSPTFDFVIISKVTQIGLLNKEMGVKTIFLTKTAFDKLFMCRERQPLRGSLSEAGIKN